MDRYCHSQYYENSHLNFTNLFMWREPYQIKICEENDVLYMISTWQDELMALQPLGAEDKMQEAIGKLAEYFKEQGKPLVFSGIEKFFVRSSILVPDLTSSQTETTLIMCIWQKS